MNFALSKWPHLHRVYVVTFHEYLSLAVSSLDPPNQLCNKACGFQEDTSCILRIIFLKSGHFRDQDEFLYVLVMTSLTYCCLSDLGWLSFWLLVPYLSLHSIIICLAYCFLESQTRIFSFPKFLHFVPLPNGIEWGAD